MNIYEVVTKLVGSIQPVGETNEDERRFENLKTMTNLISALLPDIENVVHCKDRVEFSIRRAGEYADNFLKELEKH